MSEQLSHHGIIGMKWGVRRTPAQLGHLSKKDERWAKRKGDSITKKARKQSAREMDSYTRQLLNNPDAFNKSGRLSASTINSYNRKLASVMSTKVSNLRSPSGKTVQFIAKRGEIGVFMAIADQGYNIDQLKNGIYGSGRVAYKKTVLDKVDY